MRPLLAAMCRALKHSPRRDLGQLQRLLSAPETIAGLPPPAARRYPWSPMPPTLSPDDTIVVSKDQVAADLSGEVVILGMSEGAYFSVSEVAARVWALLQTPRRLGDVVDILMSEYDVPADQCTVEVLAFVEDLAARGLVVRDAAPRP